MAVDVVPTVIYSNMMGVALFALLEASKKPENKQTRYLKGLLCLLLINVLGELYIFTGAYELAPWLAGAQFPLRMLLGPALYFYACASMSAHYKMSWRAALAAMSGPILVILAMVPFVFGLSSAEKLSLANPATRDPELFKIALYTCFIATCVFILFTAGYLVASLKLHTQFRKQLMDKFSALEKRSLDWFRIVLYAWGVAWACYAAEFGLGLFRVSWFGSGIVLPILEAVVLMWFVHLALSQSTLTDSEKATTESTKPRSPSLDSERMHSIATHLIHCMENEKLYLEEDLSLQRLSDAISVSENHISETLSQHLNTNFFQFVNGYRIDAAKRALLTSNKLVSTVAYDVGFNSKSTFNNAFKKTVGLTPTAYRNQQKMEPVNTSKNVA